MSEGVNDFPWFDSQWQGGEVSPFAYAVVAPNASWETFEGTNTWILHTPDCPRCYIVDPGPDDESHLKSVCDVVKCLNLESAAILVTHEHVDHVEGAQHLAEMLSVPVFSRKRGNLSDGTFALAGAPELKAISLPGHSSDSVGFLFYPDASIVTGDVLFWKASSSIVWPDGSLKDYMETLDKLETLVLEGSCKRFLTGHRRPIDDCLDVIRGYRTHRIERLDMVRQAVRKTRSTDIDVLIPVVYNDVEPQYHPMCRLNLKVQLAYLQETKDPVLDDVASLF